jgi:hypothetical protein
MVAGVFLGCATPPPKAMQPPELTLEEPRPPNNPLIAITPDIITLATANNADITDFHYFISTSIVLELIKEDRRVGSFAIDPRTGEGHFTEINRQDQIEILPGTRGVIRNHVNTNADMSVIEICFDESDFDRTLTFEKNMAGDRFNLSYDKATQSINYGGKRYKVNLFNAVNLPYLLVRYGETITNRSNIRKLGGRLQSQHITGSISENATRNNIDVTASKIVTEDKNGVLSEITTGTVNETGNNIRIETITENKNGVLTKTVITTRNKEFLLWEWTVTTTTKTRIIDNEVVVVSETQKSPVRLKEF